jgi:para-nitrobenzyl esterase
MSARPLVNYLFPLVLLSGLLACTPEEVDKVEAVNKRPTVSAGGESLQGVVLDEATGLTVFRGIPFAAPPTGDRRWKLPAAHTPRSGPQLADHFGPACPQLQGNHDWYRQVATLFGNPPETIGPLEDIDEDCLYLNVWTNSLESPEKLPVMVWIYGGANRNGYSNEPNYHGDGLAPRGVVFVSINYRVGVMGFMGHPGLAAESENGVTGNYAILDQIAALKWVQGNIEAFGGDPDNVTIFGESAGAANSATLTASPLSAGLFKRVISQSGGYQLGQTMTQADAEDVGAKIAAHLGFDSSMDDADVIDGMRQLDWETVLSEVANAKVGRYTSVVVDDYVLPDAAGRIFQNGEQNVVDLMIGTNANEYFMYQPEDFSRDKAEASIDAMGEPWAGEIMALVSSDLDSDHRLVADRVAGGSRFLCPSKFMADSVDQNGGSAYFYHFTRVRPEGEKILAYHGAEIPYALDTADSWLPADDVDARLTNIMAQYWVNFARTGSPNGEGLPMWPAYTVNGGKYMELGDEVREGEGLEAELCAIVKRQLRDRLKVALESFPRAYLEQVAMYLQSQSEESQRSFQAASGD